MLLHEIEKTEIALWLVYIIRCADSTLYCGITKNMAQRLEKHNGIRQGGAKYTKGRRPVELVTCVRVATKREALQLEIRIKKMPRIQKIAFVQGLSNTDAQEKKK